VNHLRNLNIVYLPIASLTPYAGNPKTHKPRQIRQIADSMRRFGWTNPILIDDDRRLIAGHGRIKAAKLLGFKEVPTIRLSDMSEVEKHAYLLADNRLAENAGWDEELLALELEYVSKLDVEFDLTVTGFDTGTLDFLLGTTDPKGPGDTADDLPEVDDRRPTVTKPGDLWLLGEHRLLCADATKADSFNRLMGDKRAQLVFVDPPFNVSINGNVSGLGAIKHREFVMGSGEMSEAEFARFLKTIFGHLIAASVDGSIHFVCMDWRHCFELLSAARDVYTELKNLCIWNKDNGGMGSLYRSKHELIFVFKNGHKPHVNNVELGVYGRNRTNVWDYPGVNSMREGRLEQLALHPTVKPVALVADAILDCSKRRGVVLDCFGGSGTTVLACEKTGRLGHLMELDPAYVDVAIRRFHKSTGKATVHAMTQKSFGEMEVDRAGEKRSIVSNKKTKGGDSDVK
jgi:DNA modification methylase